MGSVGGPVSFWNVCSVHPLRGLGPFSFTMGFHRLRAALVVLRVEEVNWAAWEQTLPTVCEEPSGPGDPSEYPRGETECVCVHLLSRDVGQDLCCGHAPAPCI